MVNPQRQSSHVGVLSKDVTLGGRGADYITLTGGFVIGKQPFIGWDRQGWRPPGAAPRCRQH